MELSTEVLQQIIKQAVGEMSLVDILREQKEEDIMDAIVEIDSERGEWDFINKIFEVFLDTVVPDLKDNIETDGKDYINPKVRELLMAYNLVRMIKG